MEPLHILALQFGISIFMVPIYLCLSKRPRAASRMRRGWLCQIVGNALLIGAILGRRKLRTRHELLVIVGLSAGDLVYGAAN